MPSNPSRRPGFGATFSAGRLGSTALVALGAAALLAACASGKPAEDMRSSSSSMPMSRQPAAGAPMPQAAAPARPDAMAEQQKTVTGTKYAADPGMRAVLEQLAALGGKPIETLTPAQARMQPTPADAVKALLIKQGRSTEPTETGARCDEPRPA